MNAIPIQDSTEPRNYTSPPALDRLLTMNEVRRLTSLGRTTIYSMIHECSFPAPIKIGKSRIAFTSSSIARWLSERQLAA